MKKQLLIAAVAATMGAAAIADISISGAAKVNWTNTDYTAAGSYDTNTINHDVDFTISGKSGDTTVSATFATTSKTTAGTAGTANTPGVGSNNETTAAVANTPTVLGSGGLNVENVFLTTSIAGVNIKTGSYAGGDSMMGDGSRADGKISLDTTISGVKVQFEDTDAAGNNSSITVSGEVSGITLSHEIFDIKTDSKISGTFGGVTATFRSVDSDTNTADMESVLVSTNVKGVTLTYADVDANATHSSDAFFGTVSSMTDATGFSAAGSLAGNGVTFKSYEIDNVDHTKLIVNRPMAGGTFEVTMHDNGVADIIDLELAVKF
jgi:hypothetical protein